MTASLVQPASAAMPSEGEIHAAFVEAQRQYRAERDANLAKQGYWPDRSPAPLDFLAKVAHALFAPILAEKERAPYSIGEPEVGWRSHGSFSPEEKAKLRPVAETLAMLDGNAFFGNEVSAGAEWYEQYLPEAHALYEGNGGDSGWAGEASFAKPDARALAAEAALAAERANAVDGSIDIRLDDKGGVDEIFGNGVLCHIERMNKGEWFVIMTRPDQSQEAFWLTGKGKVDFTLHEHREAPTTGPNVEPWTIAAAIRAQGE